MPASPGPYGAPVPPDPYAAQGFPDGTYADGQHADGRYADGAYGDGQYADGAHPGGAHPGGAYPDGGYPDQAYAGGQGGYPGPGAQYAAGRYQEDADYLLVPGQDDPDQPPPGGRRSRRGKKHGRVRRLVRRPTVRVILGLILIFFCWVAFSLGQALTANNGLSMSSKLAEWARDHYLGSVVTLMEQLTYTPPQKGGKPGFSLSDPQGNLKFKHVHGFKPDVPKNLTPFATPALAGEGAWRLQETVRGEPALFTTFMRVNAVNTSYVAAIASFDQRLVKFQLHPGSQDPGAGFGGVPAWIPTGARKGLLATFNGGFRLNASKGGFYLNGSTSGTLTSGAASVVYYRNGTIKVGEWGRDVNMTSDVVGVRQNLKLIVDQARVVPNINTNVEAQFGATLGGAYAVWRSGIGITKNNRIIYVYGPALTAANLADMLQRAGAVEGMELDINPYWTTFEYYHAAGHPARPTPVVLLPNQQTPATRYLSIWGRDFTAVYAR
jgi:hypothetical protein